MVKNNTDRNGAWIGDVLFIDFQYACWTSPAIDLHYFLNTSLHESLRFGCFDELIVIYHSHLVEYLKRLDYEKPIPDLDEFKQQYDEKKFFGTNNRFSQNWRKLSKHFIFFVQVL